MTVSAPRVFAFTILDISNATTSSGGDNLVLQNLDTPDWDGIAYYNYCVSSTNTNGALVSLLVQNQTGSPAGSLSSDTSFAFSSSRECHTGSMTSNNGGLLSSDQQTLYLIFGSGGNNGAISMQDGDFIIISSTDDFSDTSTHIISLYPENGTTTSSGTPVEFEFNYYISPNDLSSFRGVKVSLHNLDQNVLIGADFTGSDIYFYDREPATTSGSHTFSTTTMLADGNYAIEAMLEGTTFLGIINPFVGFLGTIDSQINQFIVGSSTFIGNISQNSIEQVNAIFASTTATSTQALAFTCSPVSSNISTAFLNPTFSPVECLAFLFIPDASYLRETLTTFKNDVLTHFPLGYLTDAYFILSTTTVATLDVVDTTLPFFGNPHIRIGLDEGMLDYIYNATTTSFYNASVASSTETFYEYTSWYWEIFVYISLLLYIITRIIGSHLIPKL